MEAIAVIGMACRFPGSAISPEKLWKMMVNKESAWTEFPKDRLNINGYYHPSGDRQGSISFKGAHFLRQDVAAFDASFFSVMAEDAKAMDPQQRLLLEVSYEALENAGLPIEGLRGTPTAVYVGSFVKDYEQICLRDMDWQPQYAATGTGNAIMSNRISYTYDFKGPSMTIDTGCSGSLVAVHLAAQALRSGDCSLALAAGAGMILTPNTMMPMTALNFLSPDGKCFAFDSRANGYGRGEGIGFVVLKRLSDAVKDNDTIRAVIRGTHVNQDGSTPGITLPSKEAQVANIRHLYSKHGLDMHRTAFVECHGTGTQAGDTRELKAISETLSVGRHCDNPVLVGSVKTNIGHLEGAAGIAGLIKGVLIIEKGEIPPNINFEKGNPDIKFEDWGVKVPTDLTQWPLEGPRRVSINCFGFGGTNAHVVIDELSSHLSDHRNPRLQEPDLLGDTSGWDAPERRPQLFLFSSHERNGVSRVMKAHLNHINDRPDFLKTGIDDYAYTLACRRSVLEWRGFAVARDADGLKSSLEAAVSASLLRSNVRREPKVAFVFCGQGAQWVRMGHELMCFQPFKNSLESAANYIRTLGGGFDLVREIMEPESTSRIQDPVISQPATTAIQMALVDLLRCCKVTPSSTIGHSSGEIAAAYASGCINSETALTLAYYRGQSASLLSNSGSRFQGGMCAVKLSLDEARQYLRLAGDEKDLQIACINSPTSVTISGSVQDIIAMRDEMKTSNILCKILDVQLAYHSRHMNLIKEKYEGLIAGIISVDSPTGIRFFSTVCGGELRGRSLGPSYWTQNLVSPVQFWGAVEALIDSENRPDVFVEISPQVVLESAITEIVSSVPAGPTSRYTALMRRGRSSVVTFLETVGHLWSSGYQVDMIQVLSRGHTKKSFSTLVDLPSYPWNHSNTFWHESHTCTEHRFRNHGRQDLIGSPSPDATTFEPRWRGFFRISENPWIQDHRVQQTIVYPAAGMVAMAIEAASQMAENMSDILGFQVINLHIERAMVIAPTSHGLEYSLNLKQVPSRPQEEPEWDFSLYSKQEGGAWLRHADGQVKIRKSTEAHALHAARHSDKYSELEALCGKTLLARQLYETLDVVGLNYGPCFQNVSSVSTHGTSCISKIRIPDTKSKMPANFEYPHVIHPATLDSMFHPLFAIDAKPMVPSTIESVFVSAGIPKGAGHEFVGYALARRRGICDATASIYMAPGPEDLGSPSVVIEGLQLSALSASPMDDGKFLPNHRNLCSEIIWKEDYVTSKTDDLSQLLSLMAHKYPLLAILQCGGSEQLARYILEILSAGGPPRLARYTVTDDQTLSAIQTSFTTSPVLNLLEKREWPTTSKQAFPRYNLIIIAQDSGNNSRDACQYLLREGLVLEEISLPTAVGRLQRPSNAFRQNTSHSRAIAASYRLQSENMANDCVSEQHFEGHMFSDHLDMTSAPEVCVIVPTTTISALDNLCSSLINILSKQGFSVSVETFATAEPSNKACVSLVEVCDNFVSNWTEEQFQSFRNLQNEARSVLWVTRAANRRPSDPRNAPIIALARTILSEDSRKTIVTLDVDANTPLESALLPDVIFEVLAATLSGSHETELAEEGGKLYIPRLMPLDELNRLVESESSLEIHQQPVCHVDNAETYYEMVLSKPGLADDCFHFCATPFSGELGSHEVEIRTSTAVLREEDLKTALGLNAEGRLGLDICGFVTNVGSQVEDFRPGDQVCAIVPGAFKTVHRIDLGFVKHSKPAQRHQYTPSIFITAFYAMCHAGYLSRNKKVLIHAGASSYGQAAVRIAGVLEAEVFATVLGDATGTQRKQLVEVCGLPRDHILDADSDMFFADLIAIGKFDVIFNITKDHAVTSSKCVKASGRIIQLVDKTNRASIIPTSAMTCVKLDIGLLLEEDPELVKALFTAVDEFVSTFLRSDSDLQCEPVHNFALSSLSAAYKHLRRHPHFGLVVMTVDQETRVPVARELSLNPLAGVIDPLGTYILAGGLGGLGRSIASLLAVNGARRLVFLSRSRGGPNAEAFLDGLRAEGVDARAVCVDITDREALHPHRLSLGKISGVVQCAAVIKDALFETMTYSEWTTVFGPKAIGAINLVEVFGSRSAGPATCADDADDADSKVLAGPWFIFLSSASGVIGNRGQANYAAGNAVQDALARSTPRACSLDLGPVLEAGMLAQNDETLNKLRGAGFYGIRHQDFLKMVSYAIAGEIGPGIPLPAQIISGVGTGGLIRQNNPGDPFWSRTSLYSYMNIVDVPVTAPDLEAITRPGQENNRVKEMLAVCTGPDEAANVICAGLVQLMAKAMTLLPEEIDPGRRPSAYGVDSLVAVGVRN
ncbi:Reducing polyketide synthase FUB1 [Colletotrichum orbiculare MAFF 240422]|uniref:Reducing polyketide synthase FUB1 n=1 Tax=Colletotrichum orbiculare (strain 104-T / ATCC 96160 / CBS 514.97 / LARS 414 / MAFF 240422) TaxID=1213857 RepID=N4V3N5_COLOR|nr:Reducing polyketide synthase FUB1 [Colletotrichum orbiculare MAFF 240422]